MVNITSLHVIMSVLIMSMNNDTKFMKV